MPWTVTSRTISPIAARYESIYAKPVRPTDPDGRSDLPWLLTGAPNVLRLYPVRSMLVLLPTTPAPEVVTLPWMTPPRIVFPVVARYESIYAKPVRPIDPDGRSDLQWLMRGAPNVSAIHPIRSFLALLPTTPAAENITLPWTVAPRVVRLVPRIDSVHVEPLATSSVSWFVQAPAVVRAPAVVVSAQVLPIVISLTHGWWPPAPELVRRLLANPSRLAVPIRPLNPDSRSDLPWLVSNFLPPGRVAPPSAPSAYVIPPPGALWAPLQLPADFFIVEAVDRIFIVEAVDRIVVVSATGREFLV